MDAAFNDPEAVRAARAAERAQPVAIDWRATIRRRLVVIGVVFGLWVVGVEATLLHLQVFDRARMVERAEMQQQLNVEIRAKRGDIVDRNGRLLAFSVDGEEIVADPSEVEDPIATAEQLCAVLDSCSRDERQQFIEKLSKKKSRYQVLKRRATLGEAQRARAIQGLSVTMQSVRYYPNRDLGATVLGWVNLENKGVAGIEHAYDEQIGGRPGSMLQLRDRKARALSLQVTQSPQPGANLRLTIDSYLQYMVERELDQAIKATKADGAVAVVLQPETGDILAMASMPDFNPNHASISKAEADGRRNRAVQDTFEYASVVKVATAAAAIEEHLFSFTDMFDVSSGQIQIGNRKPIRDVHTYGSLSFMDVIVKSSNVGIIKVGLRLGADRMDRYFRQFGFGQRLSPDFPAERSGNVWPREKLSDSAIASMAMGYQVGITPLQMASAVNSVANGGELMEPRLVKAIARDSGTEERAPRAIRRTMSRATAERLREMMEQVVERGTAKTAQIDGYTLAAKTGTAAKIENGTYSDSHYNASTAGFVPSVQPVATILVTIDTPRVGGYFGGSAAAPVFKRIAEATLRHYGVAGTRNPAGKYVVAGARETSQPEPTPVRMPAPAIASIVPAAQGLMPDLTGVSAREAVRMIAALGMAVRVAGNGVVVAQSVPPGTPAERGTTCVLTLQRGGNPTRDVVSQQP